MSECVACENESGDVRTSLAPFERHQRFEDALPAHHAELARLKGEIANKNAALREIIRYSAIPRYKSWTTVAGTARRALEPKEARK